MRAGPPISSATVCICTRNRAPLLRRVLEDLVRLNVPKECRWDVLVVDNGSADETPAIVEEFVGRLPMRCVVEPRPGLSVARNRGCAEASGEVILFTDDDVRVDADWLREHLGAFREGRCDYVGGRVIPLWEQPRPRWLRDEGMPLLEGLLVRHDLGEADRPYGEGATCPVGANFGFGRDWFRRVGPFREDLGVRDRVRAVGEETEWISRARRFGARGWYVSRALVRHPVDLLRFGWKRLFEHGIQSGVAYARVHPGAPAQGSRAAAAGFLVKGLWQGCRGRGDRLRQCVVNAGIQVGVRRELRGTPGS